MLSVPGGCRASTASSAQKVREVRTDLAPREDVSDRVWALGPRSGTANGGQARDLRLLGLYAYDGDKPAGQVHDPSQDDEETPAAGDQSDCRTVSRSSAL